MECENCHIRGGLYEAGRWCSKCSVVHKKEVIVQIPCEVFIEHIIPHLFLTDIRDLSEVSRGMNDYMNRPIVWRSVYQMSLGSKYYKKLLHRLSHSKPKELKGRPTSVSESHVSVVIQNTTTDIPFDIHHIRMKDADSTVALTDWKSRVMVPHKHGHGLLPGKSFACKTFHGHMWTCIPTEDWLRNNQVSNVGCMFVANRGQRMWIHPQVWTTTYGTDAPPRLVHLHQIREPTYLHKIKDVNKVYSNYKHAFLRLVMDPNKVRENSVHNKEMMDKNKSEIKNLYGIIHALEKKQRQKVIRDHHYTAMKKIL